VISDYYPGEINLYRNKRPPNEGGLFAFLLFDYLMGGNAETGKPT
jgi:hypothetical protein